MDKVGIITWYWGNYGSILQAYAIQNAIASLGYDCEIIQHHVNGNIKTQLKYRLAHLGLKKTIGYYSNKLRVKLENPKNNSRLKLRDNAFNDFIKNNLILSAESYNNINYYKCQQYDTYVCGSDQIWNPSFTFLSTFYWLGFVQNGKKISYAPSMGSEPLNNLEKKIINEYLNSFSAVSVREEKTAKMLNDILRKGDVVTVADPTMLIEANTWRNKIPKSSINEKYLFAYLIRGNKEQRVYISSTAKQKKLTLVTYPYLEGNTIEKDEKYWGDIQCFEDNPFDFLGRIANADLVITDSFHCSVFSLMFHKDFYVMRKANDITSQFGRLEQLLGMCHEENRIIEIGDVIPSLNDDYVESDNAIENVRRLSKKFLEEALNMK